MITPILLWLILTFLPLTLIILIYSINATEESARVTGWFLGILCLPISAIVALSITIFVMLYFKGVFKE
jgi:hypothetical protein